MIAENLKILNKRINDKCCELNRNPQKIKLIAVSKTYSVDAISSANDLGLTDFGENKAQELRDKYNVLSDKVNWHFIGNLQRNKVKYVVKSASFIHSVDSITLADEINKQASKLGKVQKILLEVKTSFEESKSGAEGEESLKALTEHCTSLENVNLIGLMTMAPFTNDEKIIRQSFSELRKLKDKLNGYGFNLSELSMGMTNDFEIGIEEGATMLRIGSAIFGKRDYTKQQEQL
ncbi:MAG: YggS family pyridoxal phosphate-dependent enzyme [Ignavibacteriae bacterium]|nr:MAG: YggS family pyridoxal phosphate-dependent enzyme [Ignavibacteriota bacterium]